MREQKSYICDHCGTSWPTKDKATICEASCLEKLNEKTEEQRKKESLEKEKEQFLANHFATCISVEEIYTSIEKYFEKYTDVQVVFSNKSHSNCFAIDDTSFTASTWYHSVSFKEAKTGKLIYDHYNRKIVNCTDAKSVLKSLFKIDSAKVEIQIKDYPLLLEKFKKENLDVIEADSLLASARNEIRKKLNDNEEIFELKKKFEEIDKKLIELYDQQKEILDKKIPEIVGKINKQGANKIKNEFLKIKSRGGPFGQLNNRHIESVFGHVSIQSDFADQMSDQFQSSEC